MAQHSQGYGPMVDNCMTTQSHLRAVNPRAVSSAKRHATSHASTDASDNDKYLRTSVGLPREYTQQQTQEEDMTKDDVHEILRTKLIRQHTANVQVHPFKNEVYAALLSREAGFRQTAQHKMQLTLERTEAPVTQYALDSHWAALSGEAEQTRQHLRV